jgi:uncharacterized caspase-like protein
MLQAGRRQDLMGDITMSRRPLGLMITLALAFLWRPLAVASPPSGTSAPLLVATTAGVQERRTAIHDAIDMAAALRQLGFQVLERHDATRQRMDEAIAQFTRQLGSGGVAAFYFSGQGVQENGVNYLLPVDARLSRESDFEDQALRLDGVLDRLREAGDGVNLIILDASRHNLFTRGGRSGRLAQVAILGQSGTLIVYATAPGMVAEDGPGRNSTYTTHLLHFLKLPGLSVDQLFQEVRMAVARETGRRQIPWVSSSIPGKFSFAGR